MKKVRLLESIQVGEHTNMPSRYDIGERVKFQFGKFADIPAYVRCCIHTMGKVRYTLLLDGGDDMMTSIHNVDSCCVVDFPDENGNKVIIDLDFDNYS